MTNKEFDIKQFEDEFLLHKLSDIFPEETKGDEDETQRLQRLVSLVKRVKHAEKYAGFQKWFIPGTPYGIDKLPKHREFLFAGKKYHERYFSAANRAGKTLAATFEMCLHLTGLYPEWWKGRRFSHGVLAYSAGSTNETTRNILQKELLGEVGSWGTGMLPLDLVVKTTAKSGVSNAVDMLQVRHVSGEISTLRFKSYDQGRRAFEGESVHVVHLDEMPDLETYSECVARTLSTNGIVLVTATPLDGMTPLVLSFYAQSDILPVEENVPDVIRMAKEDFEKEREEAEKAGERPIPTNRKTSKAVIFAGWNDAPWLTEDAKIRVLEATPPHLRQARSTGIPGDTGGMVFPIPLSDVVIDDFPIPSHYKLINGLDPGWNFTGAVFGAVDPDTETLYIYGEHKRSKAETVVHAEAIKSKSKWKDAPLIIDPRGIDRDGEQTMTLYRKHGLKLIPADKSVEAGISLVWDMMSTGKLKIFKSCKELQKEFVTYHRDDKGRIVKDNDHCLHPDTLVMTDKGKKKIVDLVGTEGKVLTVGGKYTDYRAVRKTQSNQEVVKVVFEDGYSVMSTPDHLFLTEHGWVQAIDTQGLLVYSGVSQSINGEDTLWKKSKSFLKRSKSSLAKLTGFAGSTSKDTEDAYTAQCMNTTTDPSRMVGTYTTKTTTKPTMTSETLNFFVSPNTCPYTKRDTTDHQQSTHTKWRLFGTVQKKVLIGIEHITKKLKTSCTNVLKGFVHTAESRMRQLENTGTLFAQTSASHLFDGQVELTTQTGPAQFAGHSSISTSTQGLKHAQENVQTKSFRKVVRVETVKERSDVYCMEVPETHCFAVGNGAIVHNCLDPLRYVCMGVKHARTPQMGKAMGVNNFGRFKGNVSGKKYF